MSYLENTEFETIFRMYNGDDLEARGVTYVRSNPDDMYDITFDTMRHTGYRFRNMTKITHDYTGHDTSDPIHDVLFTWSNGVSLVRDSAISQSGSNYYYGERIYYVDKDNNYIDFNSMVGRYMTDTPTSVIGMSYQVEPTDVTSYTTYNSYPGYIYDGDESKDAYTWTPTGFRFIPQPTASPYERPELIGDISYDRVGNYYYGPFYSDLYDQTWIDRFFDALENAGDGSPLIPEKPSDDTSGPGGGDDALPDYNPFSDPIDFPGLPTGGDSLSTGFIRAYNPSTSQLQALSRELWSDGFINTIKKVQNDPFEAIISLHSVPFNVVSGASVLCSVGNYESRVSMPPIYQQFMTLDLGSIQIPEHWASALDYSPYVTVDIFLPFVGVITLQVDDVIGKTLQVKYNVDILSGATVASIKCGDSVLYTHNTNLLFRHPVTQSSFGPLYQSILGLVGNTMSGAVSGGIGGAVGGGLGSGINVALSKHSNVSRGGSIGGATGCLGNFKPYLIIHRPIQSLASGFAHFKGYPSNITGTIGSVSGYTEVESVHLTGIPCTDAERDEIMALLYNGVIV